MTILLLIQPSAIEYIRYKVTVVEKGHFMTLWADDVHGWLVAGEHSTYYLFVVLIVFFLNHELLCSEPFFCCPFESVLLFLPFFLLHHRSPGNGP